MVTWQARALQNGKPIVSMGCSEDWRDLYAAFPPNHELADARSARLRTRRFRQNQDIDG